MSSKVDNVCNYCRLKKLRAEALERGHFIRVRDATNVPLGGVDVFEVPDPAQYYNLRYGQPDYDKYFKCWFMAVGDNCTC